MSQKATLSTKGSAVISPPKKPPHVRDYPSIAESLRQFDSLPDSAHVRQPVVESLFGISHSSVWRWVAAGHLPKPRKHGVRTTAWNVGELRAVLSRQAA